MSGQARSGVGRVRGPGRAPIALASALSTAIPVSRVAASSRLVPSALREVHRMVDSMVVRAPHSGASALVARRDEQAADAVRSPCWAARASARTKAGDGHGCQPEAHDCGITHPRALGAGSRLVGEARSTRSSGSSAACVREAAWTVGALPLPACTPTGSVPFRVTAAVRDAPATVTPGAGRARLARAGSSFAVPFGGLSAATRPLLGRVRSRREPQPTGARAGCIQDNFAARAACIPPPGVRESAVSLSLGAGRSRGARSRGPLGEGHLPTFASAGSIQHSRRASAGCIQDSRFSAREVCPPSPFPSAPYRCIRDCPLCALVCPREVPEGGSAPPARSPERGSAAPRRAAEQLAGGVPLYGVHGAFMGCWVCPAHGCSSPQGARLASRLLTAPPSAAKRLTGVSARRHAHVSPLACNATTASRRGPKSVSNRRFSAIRPTRRTRHADPVTVPTCRSTTECCSVIHQCLFRLGVGASFVVGERPPTVKCPFGRNGE